MKQSHSLLNSLYLLAVTSLVCLIPLNASVANDSRQQARVVKVVDGDTIVVEIGSRREHLRLIGIDTPECKTNRHAEKQSRERHLDQQTVLRMGNQAADHTRVLLPKKSTVFLEFDSDKRDHYDRLLAYVWLSNGTMANEEIVKAGYAYLLTIPPNVKYRERFATAFSDARKNKRGLWVAQDSYSRGGSSRQSREVHTSPAVAAQQGKW
jgi:micrococcal nuclease